MGQIELICRVPPWKTEPTPSRWHPITAPPYAEPTPLLLQGQKSALPLKVAGTPSSPDITLLLETAAPYDCCVVWPGLSTSPGRPVGGASQGESLALSLCQANGFAIFNGAIMSQRFQSLFTGSSQSYNYPLAIGPYFGFSFLKSSQDIVNIVHLVCPRG